MQIKKLVKENDVKKLDWDHLMETILESRPRSQVLMHKSFVYDCLSFIFCVYLLFLVIIDEGLFDFVFYV